MLIPSRCAADVSPCFRDMTLFPESPLESRYSTRLRTRTASDLTKRTGIASAIGHPAPYRTLSNPRQTKSAAPSTRQIAITSPQPGRFCLPAFFPQSTPSSAYHAAWPHRRTTRHRTAFARMPRNALEDLDSHFRFHDHRPHPGRTRPPAFPSKQRLQSPHARFRISAVWISAFSFLHSHFPCPCVENGPRHRRCGCAQ